MRSQWWSSKASKSDLNWRFLRSSVPMMRVPSPFPWEMHDSITPPFPTHLEVECTDYQPGFHGVHPVRVQQQGAFRHDPREACISGM